MPETVQQFETCDPIWSDLRAQAHEVVKTEPMLASACSPYAFFSISSSWAAGALNGSSPVCFSAIPSILVNGV